MAQSCHFEIKKREIRSEETGSQGNQEVTWRIRNGGSKLGRRKTDINQFNVLDNRVQPAAFASGSPSLS